MSRILSLFSAVLMGLLLVSCDGTSSSLKKELEGGVSLYWSPPLTRVNGEQLTSADIEGYEIRYWHSSETEYKTVFVDQDGVDSHHFDSLPKSLDGYTFQVATVDKNGLYSEFVTAEP